jgi:hypothetical protein
LKNARGNRVKKHLLHPPPPFLINPSPLPTLFVNYYKNTFIPRSLNWGIMENDQIQGIVRK